MEQIQWLIGLGATVILGLTGMVVGGFARTLKLIRNVERDVQDREANLHLKIDRVRDDSVHRGDLEAVTLRLTKDLHEIRDEQRTMNRDTNARLDALLSAIANRNAAKGGGND